MSSDNPSDSKLEIAHVLAMDVVGYSTLLINKQSRVLADLNRIVREAARFREADAQGKLLRLPTGDGMALVFFNDPEAPIECAMEIAAAMKSSPEIRLRMGIHSGPVNQVVDVNDRSNIAGAGIDIAQRVMDCGDAGHILLSKRVTEDLAPLARWNPHLHELGECDVKHGRQVSLVDFYTAEVGNPARPIKCASGAAGRSTSAALNLLWQKPAFIAALALFAIALVLAAFVFSRSRILKLRPNAAAAPADSQSIAVL